MSRIPNPAARVVRYARTHGVMPGLRKARSLATRYLTMPDLPPTLHVEVSNVCNLNCEYCVLDQGARGDRVMSDETFARMLPFLRNALRIHVSGLAEPLMNTRFTSMLAEIRRVAPTAGIQMCTNASLLTEEIAHRLVDSRLDELVFSLDGVDPEHFDEVRHGASLDGLLGSIETLRAVSRARGSRYPALSATTVLQRGNIDQFPEVVRLAARMGVTTINVNGLEPYVASVVEGPLWADPDSVEGFADTLREAANAAEETGIELRMTALRPQPAVCPQIFRPIILADGSVVPCSVLAYPRDSHLAVDESLRAVRHEGVTERVTFGTIKERSFRQIWRSAEYRSFRRRVRTGDFPPSCATCLMKHYVICPQPPMTVDEAVATLETGREHG